MRRTPGALVVREMIGLHHPRETVSGKPRDALASVMATPSPPRPPGAPTRRSSCAGLESLSAPCAPTCHFTCRTSMDGARLSGIEPFVTERYTLPTREYSSSASSSPPDSAPLTLYGPCRWRSIFANSSMLPRLNIHERSFPQEISRIASGEIRAPHPYGTLGEMMLAPLHERKGPLRREPSRQLAGSARKRFVRTRDAFASTPRFRYCDSGQTRAVSRSQSD